jgi:hypothetical protein
LSDFWVEASTCRLSRLVSQGPPGVLRMITKVTRETVNRTGISHNNRRIRYVVILHFQGIYVNSKHVILSDWKERRISVRFQKSHLKMRFFVAPLLRMT